MIYDVKFDGKRKARSVAGGHLTDDPGADAYAGVIAPEAASQIGDVCSSTQ